MLVSDPSESIDRSVQLPMKMPPTWWLSTTARASAAPVTPTMSSCASLSRVDMPANSAGPSPHAGAAGPAAAGAAVVAMVGAVTDVDGRAACSADGEQASRSPDIAASANSARDAAMGPHPNSSGSRVLCRGRQATRSVTGTQILVCYVGRMDRFIVPAAASIVVGLLLGAAAIFGVTLMVQQDSKPPLQPGDPASSVLNRVVYGDSTFFTDCFAGLGRQCREGCLDEISVRFHPYTT